MRRVVSLGLLALGALGVLGSGQRSPQPVVQPGPSEPDLLVILDRYYGLRMIEDLANPVKRSALQTPGLFRKAGPGLVTYAPEIALGLEVTIHGGYYARSDANAKPEAHELWSYQYKNTAKDIEQQTNLPPRLSSGSKTSFDPGDGPFGLFVLNEQFQDSVYTEPSSVAMHNKRLAAQPYKAMIYPYRDQKTHALVPHSYLIGWEYSTNDDFQDVMCRVENVVLVPYDEKP